MMICHQCRNRAEKTMVNWFTTPTKGYLAERECKEHLVSKACPMVQSEHLPRQDVLPDYTRGRKNWWTGRLGYY